MSNQISVTLGRNDQDLTKFIQDQEGVPNANELVGTHLRNQLYERKRTYENVQRNNALLITCINRLTPSQTSGILDEMPELRKKEFPDEMSASEILWECTKD